MLLHGIQRPEWTIIHSWRMSTPCPMQAGSSERLPAMCGQLIVHFSGTGSTWVCVSTSAEALSHSAHTLIMLIRSLSLHSVLIYPLCSVRKV